MTALAATAQPTATPARVLLAVTGAPSPPANSYASNFATVDGWSGASAAIVLGNLRLSGPVGQPAGTTTTGSKTLTGLTIGAAYRYRAHMVTQTQTQARLRLTGGVAGAYVITPAAGAWLELVFTATATSHVIAIDLQNTSAGTGPIVDVDTVTVQPSGTWLGTTIRRTDVNGTNVVVREDAGGMDTAGGTMTLYDLEAALTGPIGYAVTDGNGAVAYAVASFAPIVRQNLCPNPSFESGTLAPFVPFASSAAFAVTTRSHSGKWSARVDFPTAGALATGLGAWTVTGLTIGATYTFSAWLYVPAATLPAGVSVRVSGIASGNIVAVADTWVRSVVTFVATATSHNFHPVTQNNASTAGQSCYVDDVQLEAGAGTSYMDGDSAETPAETFGWLGTPGASPSASTTPGETTAGAWLTLPATAVPSTGTVSSVPVELITGIDEANESNGSLHTIVGRADKIANPGPLALRSGTLTLWARTYSVARAIRNLLKSGEIAQLRQPTFPGLDLYLYPTRVAASPEDFDSDTRRWAVELTYEEVLAP